MKPRHISPQKALRAVATKVVDCRYLIFALFLVACVYCALSVGKVGLIREITQFLPESTETRQGLDIMDEEFTTYGTASIMVSNVSYARASELADGVAAIQGVYEVSFDDTTAHYVNSAALFNVSFDGVSDSEDCEQALAKVEEYLAPYDTSVSTSIGSDYYSQLAEEMVGVLIIAVLVIIAVLLFTSRSYFEVVIFMIVFGVSALLNMGTNFWFGKISSITNSVAIILQLALAIDYAIIFSHSYQDHLADAPDEREALISALSRSMVEISSSSLTTISGLVALTLMQFRLGADLGLVLAKGILCSLLTVFLLMPGLIMVFRRMVAKTSHKRLVPSVMGWGRFLMKSRFAFVVLFALLVPAALYCSSNTEYAFNDSTIDEVVYSDTRAARHKIENTFDHDTTVAILVSKGNYEAERSILDQVENLEQVTSATGLANVEVKDGVCLADGVTPRTFAQLLDVDIEQARLLFQAYGVAHDQYQPIFGEVDQYEVPLVDLLPYLFEKIDQGAVSLSAQEKQDVDDLRASFDRGVDQLQGQNWDRLVFQVALPAESDESVQLVEQVRTIAQQYYGSDDVVIVGNITSAHDLATSFSSDSSLITLLTALFVLCILLITFRTAVGAIVLVLVIQGSIWINFSFPYLQDFHTSFITYMIVSAIQMGATIDYGIVLMNRYLSAKKTGLAKKEAMVVAVDQAFITVMTSGCIMTVAGFLIGLRVSDVYVGHIGLAVGRGALISMIVVLTVLPQLIVLCDTAIEKTRFRLNLKAFFGLRGQPDASGVSQEQEVAHAQ